MGSGIVLLLWAFIGALGLAVVYAGIVVAREGMRLVGAALIVLGATIALCVAGAITALSLGSIPTTTTSPDSFEGVFGIPPPPDVSGLKSFSKGASDFTLELLTFQCSRRTFSVISRHDFLAQPCSGYASSTTRADAPDWWHPSIGPTSLCFKPSSVPTSGHVEAYLLFNPETGTAYYQFLAVD